MEQIELISRIEFEEFLINELIKEKTIELARNRSVKKFVEFVNKRLTINFRQAVLTDYENVKDEYLNKYCLGYVDKLHSEPKYNRPRY